MSFLAEEIPNDTPLNFKAHLIPDGKLIHKGTFSPNLKEYYYTISDKSFKKFDVFVINNIEGKWSDPQEAFFNTNHNEHGMSFSPDGNTLFFSSTRPVNVAGVTPTWHIWQSKKLNGNWQKPTFVDIPNLREKLVSHASMTNSGKIYFHASNIDFSEMDIYESKISHGQFENAIKTVIEMPTKIGKCTPFVSPTGDYFIFATIGEQLNLMISYPDGKGGWTHTKKLNDAINTLGQGNPYVTPDNTFLFYTTGDHIKKQWKVKWVNIASALENNKK